MVASVECSSYLALKSCDFSTSPPVSSCMPAMTLLLALWQALLEALLLVDRGSVCEQVVGVPTGMQALVDLLDDR